MQTSRKTGDTASSRPVKAAVVQLMLRRRVSALMGSVLWVLRVQRVCLIGQVVEEQGVANSTRRVESGEDAVGGTSTVWKRREMEKKEVKVWERGKEKVQHSRVGVQETALDMRVVLHPTRQIRGHWQTASVCARPCVTVRSVGGAGRGVRGGRRC